MNFQIPDCLRNSFLSCIKSPRLRIFHPENTEDTSYRLPASERRTKLVLIWSSVSGSLPLSKLLLPKACRVGSLFLSVSKISLDVYKYVSEMEPGGACNWRRESFWGCRGVSPLISLIIAFPPLQSLSSFKIPILQQLELLELSSLFRHFSYTSQLRLSLFGEISSVLYSRLLTWSLAVSYFSAHLPNFSEVLIFVTFENDSFFSDSSIFTTTYSCQGNSLPNAPKDKK